MANSLKALGTGSCRQGGGSRADSPGCLGNAASVAGRSSVETVKIKRLTIFTSTALGLESSESRPPAMRGSWGSS